MLHQVLDAMDGSPSAQKKLKVTRLWSIESILGYVYSYEM